MIEIGFVAVIIVYVLFVLDQLAELSGYVIEMWLTLMQFFHEVRGQT